MAGKPFRQGNPSNSTSEAPLKVEEPESLVPPGLDYYGKSTAELELAPENETLEDSKYLLVTDEVGKVQNPVGPEQPEQEEPGPMLSVADTKGQLSNFADIETLAVMIYPQDPDARNQFVATLKIYLTEDMVEHGVCSPDMHIAIQNDLLIPHGGLKTLNYAPGIETVHDQIEQGTLRGLLVGSILYRIIQMEVLGIKYGINRAIDIVEKGGKHLSIPGPTSRRSLQGFWIQYRSVAHLWGAYVVLNYLPVVGDPSFKQLRRILSFAEFLRRIGVILPLHERNGFILNPSDTWVIPSTLKFPPNLVLGIPPLEDWAEELLVASRDRNHDD